MTTKYTRGPWFVGKTAAFYWVHNGNQTVAKIVNKSLEDARLMAASPELLEALRYVLAVCPAIDSIGEEARSEARAAIAKALG